MTYKHFVELDKNNIIIKCFSNAYEQPTKNSICVNENGARQFNLVIQDDKGLYNKKLLDGKIVDYENKVSVSERRKSLISSVKQESGVRILQAFPDWKQRNLDVEALLLRNKSQTEVLTAKETVIINLHVKMRDDIKFIRDKSNSIEISISKKSLSELENFNIKEEALWQ